MTGTINPGTRWMESIGRYCGTLSQETGVHTYAYEVVLECPHMHKKWIPAIHCAQRAVKRFKRTGMGWPTEAGREVGTFRVTHG